MRPLPVLTCPSCVGLAVMLLAGCGEPPAAVRTIELRGEIRLPPQSDADGLVYVNLYHAWAGAGELRHPLQFISGFRTAPGPFSHRFDYPLAEGEGLVVYAWVDFDGDAVLCTPSYRLDLAGLTEVADFPADKVHATVNLTAPCRGPDWFYPQPDTADPR